MSATAYERLVRPLLFRFDAERMHDRAVWLSERIGRCRFTKRLLARRYRLEAPRLATKVAGIEFGNPIGLAAGMDKNGRMLGAMSALGFGFLEVGSVSAEPSEGNPRPRLFRLPLDEAIAVNYGVPNEGAEAVSERVRTFPADVPLGVNIVETNTGSPATPEHVIDEFVRAAKVFTASADYLSLNLNCPNTGAGQSLFDSPEVLRNLLGEYRRVEGLPPVLLKVPPATEPATINGILETVDPFPFVRGFAFNLPPGKPYDLRTPKKELDRMPGAVSGRPTRRLMNAAIRAWYERMDTARYRIIGIGGIFSPEDAYEKIRLGASLVQLLTALVYHGPGVVRRINEGLCTLLARDGFQNVSEAVGVDSQGRPK